MDRVASLLVKAADTRRKIFASLPWGFRLATIFLAMEGAMLEAWGRQVGALLLQAGVKDMPEPGAKWKPEKPNVKDLPRGYCQDVAKQAYGIALKLSGNPATADDAMQDFLLKLLSGQTKIDGGKSFTAVVSFLLTGIKWEAGAGRKKNDRRREQSVDDDNDGEGSTIDLVDEAFESNPYWSAKPQQFQKIEDVFPREVWRNEVLPATTKVHPDMGFFFALLEDGYTAKEIIEGEMLPDFDPKDYKTPLQTWNAKVQKAKEIIRQKAREYGNDLGWQAPQEELHLLGQALDLVLSLQRFAPGLVPLDEDDVPGATVPCGLRPLFALTVVFGESSVRIGRDAGVHLTRRETVQKVHKPGLGRHG